jgi:hypothetical protein
VPRARKYASDAARKTAYEKRQAAALATTAAAAAAVPKDAQSILCHLANLRNEIPRRLAALGCERKRKWTFLPGPSAPGYSFLLEGLVGLLNFIEIRLDMTGVRADRGLTAGEAPRRASLVQHLESLRDEIVRRRAAIGLQRGLQQFILPGADGWRYGVLLNALIELLNTVQKELDQSESWPIKA